MRIQGFGKTFVMFLCLIPTIVFSQENSLGDFSKALERKFLSESATLKDAEKVIQNLYSSNDREFSNGLYFSPFVSPRFPSLKDKIEKKLIQILNNNKEKRFFQGTEAALAIHFSKRNAEKLNFKKNEIEINLVKAIIKEKAGAKFETTPERIIAEFKSERGEIEKPLVDENSLKEAFMHCTLFREIIEISLSMKYYGISNGFSKIVTDHPNNFDKESVSYAQGVLEQIKRNSPRKNFQ